MQSWLDPRSLTSTKLHMRLLHRRGPPSPPSPPFPNRATATTPSTATPSSPPPSSAHDPPTTSCPTLSAPSTSKLPPRPSKDAVSCPALSVDAMDSYDQPALLRRGSHPVYKIPPLNFAALSEPCVDDLHTARRRVDSLSNSLSKFRPYLYVCGDVPARDLTLLKKHAVTHVVNLGGKGIKNYFPDTFKYLRLYIRDDEREDIRPVLMSVVRFIDAARANGGVVAVHCKQGISRSVTAALAYVMAREGVSLEEGMKDMRKCRPIAHPNTAFYQALCEMEACMRRGGEKTKALVIRRHAERVGDWETPYVGIEVKGVMVEGEAYILHREGRRGIVVWRGKRAAEEIWREAVRFGRDMAEQEAMDARRFAHCEKIANIRFVQQGEDYGVEEEIRAVMMG